MLYEAVLRVSSLDSPDEFISELLYHEDVLCVSSLDCHEKFASELMYYIVIPVPFFQDYPDKVVFKRLHCIPAPSGA